MEPTEETPSQPHNYKPHLVDAPGRPGMTMQVKVPHAVSAWVDEAATTLGLNRSAVIRSCLARGMRAFAREHGFEKPPVIHDEIKKAVPAGATE